MAMEKITGHFTHPHPNHTLSLVTSITGKYTCDGCKEPGIGARFSCDPCHFNLHDYCARAPVTLFNFMDPHQLSRTVYDRTMHCDVCSRPIDGMCYTCRACNFDAHPGCTYFQEYIHLTNVDAKHYLRLERGPTPRFCNICRHPCTDMCYSCRACNVDVHVQCITGWRPHPAAAASIGDGGGDHGIDRNRIMDIVMKMIRITSLVMNITSGIASVISLFF